MSDGLSSALTTINRNVAETHNAVVAGFNNTISVLGAVDSHVDKVECNVKIMNDELSKLYQDFLAYVKKADMQHQLELAESRIGNIRDRLKDEFGHHESTRRAMDGIVKAADFGLVSKETITRVAEELAIFDVRYWLTPCLLALAAWINDNPELAEKAVRRAIDLDDEKTSLLFALICRRAERKPSCLKWIQRYLANQDAERLDRKAVIILDAFASGLLGADSEGLVSKQLDEWITRLSDKVGFIEQQTTQWSEAINLKKEPFSGGYTYLPRYSKTWPQMQRVMEGAYLHATMHEYFATIFNQESSGLALKDQLDDILVTLAGEFDDEELPLRRDYLLNELIIKYDGDKIRAQADMPTLQTAFETHKDFTQLLTDAAMKPEVAHASVSTQKFAIALSRDWISNAYNDITAKNRMDIPHSIEINVDNFNDQTVDGSNETELVARFEKMVEDEKKAALAANTMTLFQQYCMYGGAVIGAIGLIAMIAGNTFLGLLAIIAGAGLVLYHFSSKKAIEVRRQQIISQYDTKKEDGVKIIRATLAEVVDYRAQFAEKDAESHLVMDFLEQISPEQYVRKLSDSTRRIKTA